MFYKNTIFLINYFLFVCDSKYIEGELYTKDNWAFLTRFCFLSEEGKFEYHIEFNEDQGDPNLLLYYDTEDQWPSTYKKDKTCLEKESVLQRELNQIVNLSARSYILRDMSGCNFIPLTPTTTRPKYTLSIPTLPRIKKTTTTAKSTTTTEYTTVSTYSTDFFTTETSTLSTEDETTTVTDSTTYESSTFSKEKYLTTPAHPIKKRHVPNVPPIKNLRLGRSVICHHARRFVSSRERWWFIAVSNCNGTKGIRLKYRILMTNGPPGDYWHEHFSADEFYILPVLMAFSIAYSFLMLGIVMCSMELKQRQLLHTTYKIFVFSVVLQLFGILFQSVVYLKYAITGLTSSKIRRLGAIFMGASETCFLLLLLLLAKGYTVTRGRLPVSASIKLTIFMCLYSVTYVSIFIYEAQVFDPGEVLYLYESPAGYGLIILRVFAWFMFIYSTVFTLKRYPEKGNFYYPFNIFGTLWFVAGPVFILSANTYIDKWVRESVVCAVLLFISFGGHLMFLLLTMPSVANKNFPYHVRTTQIGIMEMTGGTTGTSTIENFGHHVYEPTSYTTTTEQIIIPLTRRTEEIFEGMYTQTAFRKRERTEVAVISGEVEPEISNGTQNVLNWSMAKNVTALELPRFQNGLGVDNQSDLDSLSKTNEDPKATERRLSSSSQQTIPEDENPNSGYLSDYVRDVPIELFTVSKMVVATHRTPSVQP